MKHTVGLKQWADTLTQNYSERTIAGLLSRKKLGCNTVPHQALYALNYFSGRFR